MRTARSRTSGENFGDLFMAPSSQELEPPQNPGRFKVTWYNGADIFDQAYDTVFLRAWKNDGAPSRYQIYVADYYGGEWRFYESAYDSNGTRIDTTLIDRKVISCGSYTGCTYAEHMGLNVTRDYLERHAATGMTFQISGRAGKEIFYIPDFHIQGFLASTPK